MGGRPMSVAFSVRPNFKSVDSEVTGGLLLIATLHVCDVSETSELTVSLHSFAVTVSSKDFWPVLTSWARSWPLDRAPSILKAPYQMSLSDWGSFPALGTLE